jgi:predicted RNA binding protein YcfA (HicA-like mRNA interferase family)
MRKLSPVHWKRLRRVFELDGFVFTPGRGDHWKGEKPGVARPIVIPAYDEIGLDIIRSCMRTAGMSRERYLKLLEKC